MPTTAPESGHPLAAEARARRLQGYLKHDAGNLALMGDLADAQLEAGLYEAARQTIQAASVLRPGDPVWEYRLAVTERMAGELASSRARLEALLARGAPEVGVLLELARVRFAQSDFHACLDAVDRLAGAPLPQTTSALVMLLQVRALHHLNRVDEAIGVAQGWLRNRSETPELKSALATLYLDAARVSDAAQLFLGAEAQGAPDAEMLSVGGFVALHAGDVGAARQRFRRALEQAPAHGRAQLGLGLVSAAEGDTVSARDLLTRAIETMPTHLGSWLALAWFHLLTDDLSGAETVVHKALDVNRNFGDSHGMAAVIAALRGDMDKARDLIRVGGRLDPRSLNVAVAGALLRHGGRMDAPGFLADALAMFQERALSQDPVMRASFLRMLHALQARRRESIGP